MSCDVAMSAAILFAAFHPAGDARPHLVLAALSGGAPPTVAGPAQTAVALNPLAREPLYADIVRRAGALKLQVDHYRTAAPAAGPLPDFEAFKTEVAALSALDMQGHLDLAKRGTDGDLKCILRGISQDLPRKLTEVEQASGPEVRRTALEEMFYLLRDNIEVITAPPQPTV